MTFMPNPVSTYSKKKNLPVLSFAEQGIGRPRIHASKGASCSSGRASECGGVGKLSVC